MSSARLFLAAAIVICVGGGRADAGDRELARQRYLTGTMLFQRGRYADALVELQRGNQADPRPEFDYNIGLCLEKLNRAVEAADAFERFLAARPHDSEAEALRADIARLRQSARPLTADTSATPSPSPTLSTPTATTPPPAAPSPSTLPPPSSAPTDTAGPQPYGAPTSVAQPFAPPAQQPFARTRRGQATIALAVVGGALLVTSAVTGGVALGDRGAYHAGCAVGHCDDAGYDAGRRNAIATDVLLGAGLAAAVSAVIVGVTRAHSRRTFAVAPSAAMHGGGLALAGAF